MKKTLTKSAIIACVLALFTVNSFAQSKFYLKLGGGYNFGSSPSLGALSNETQNGTVTNYERISLSLGKGIDFGANFGYKFNKYIGADLNVSYLIGATTEAKSITTSSTSSSSVKQNLSARMLRFIPSVVLTPGFEKINPYARFGLLLGVANATSEFDVLSTFGTNSMTSKITSKITGGLAIGLQSAIGIDYKVNEQFSLFAELNSININYSPKKEEITQSSMNGVDNLSSMTTSEKVTEYVDSYSEDSSITPDPNSPSKRIKPNLPFSSIGLNIGLVFHF